MYFILLELVRPIAITSQFDRHRR